MVKKKKQNCELPLISKHELWIVEKVDIEDQIY